MPGPATTPSSRAAAAVISWASSTTTSLVLSRIRSSASGSSSSRSAAAPRIHAGSYAPGAERAVTWSYSASTCAAASHSGRPWVRPSAARSWASRPCSTARMSRSRSSPRNPRVGSASWTRSGQAGPRLSPRRWPSRRSRRMTSCSGPLSRRGVGSPRRAAAWRRTPKPKDWWVRASGSVEVRATRAVTRSRRDAAASRDDASSRHWSGSSSPASTRPTTTSTAVVVLPVPGAPSTRSTLPRWSTAACCRSSRGGAPTTRVGARRRVSTRPIPSSGADTLGAGTPYPGRAGPAQRATARSTRRPRSGPPTSGVPSSR